jgi:hypothetical protein
VRWSRPVAFAAVALVLPLTAAQGGCEPVPQRTSDGRSGVTVIYVQNEASSAWPVRQAVSAWNAGLRRVKLRLGRCRVGATCIRVSEADFGSGSGSRVRLGETSAFGGSVRLSRNVGRLSAHDRAQTVCHELGHSLGRPHRKEFSTCMHTYIEPGAGTRPDAKDFAAVNARYRRYG